MKCSRYKLVFIITSCIQYPAKIKNAHQNCINICHTDKLQGPSHSSNADKCFNYLGLLALQLLSGACHPPSKRQNNSFFAVEQLPHHSFSHKASVLNFHRGHMEIKRWSELLPSHTPVKWPNGHYMSDKGAQFPKCEEFIIALCQGPDRLWQPAVPPTNNRPRIHKTGNTKMNKATKLQGMCQLVINLLSHPCSHRFLTVLLVIKWFVAFGNRTVCCLHKVDRWRLTLIKVYGCRCPSPSDKTDHFRSTVEALMPLCWHYCGSPLWNVSRRHANYKNVNSPLWPVPNGGIIPFIF